LPALRAAAPDVDLEIDHSARTLDLSRREADVALRLGRPRQPSLVARRVGHFGLALYASPRYLASRRKTHDVLLDDETNGWAPEAQLTQRLLPDARPVLRAGSWLLRAAACEQGVGVSALPCFIADDAVRAGRLARVGRRADVVRYEMWLIVHRELKDVARIRLVTDFLSALVRENGSALAG
jgi:DNA-binding transcriptional LysR family regulator